MTYKISYKDLKEEPVKTTPENVKEANEALFSAKWNLPKAAKHCGMSQKEMKLTSGSLSSIILSLTKRKFFGAVVESVDTPDLKSVGRMPVGVQVSLAL